MVKPANAGKASVPALNLSNLPPAKSHALTDSRNLNSDGIRMILSQENLASIAQQKRQKNALRQVLQAQDINRSFTCTLARLRSEANKLGVHLSEQDY